LAAGVSIYLQHNAILLSSRYIGLFFSTGLSALSDTGVSMLPLILLLIGCLMAFGVTVLSVMVMMYRRRGTTSPVHIEPYMKQPIITPPDSRNNSMLDVTHGDHTYFVEYTLKQVTDYALNNQPDIIQSPQGNTKLGAPPLHSLPLLIRPDPNALMAPY